jgi:hypothetical protein
MGETGEGFSRRTVSPTREEEEHGCGVLLCALMRRGIVAVGWWWCDAVVGAIDVILVVLASV